MEREGERLAKAVSGKEDARKLGGGEKRKERNKANKSVSLYSAPHIHCIILQKWKFTYIHTQKYFILQAI